MALITRLTRLFRADFNAVLDTIEEPDIQLKQAIRDMQFEYQQAQQKLAAMQQEIDQLARLEQQLEKKIEGFDEELDICFNADEDDLARSLIKRKLAATANIEIASRRRIELQKACETLASQIETYQQQIDVTTQALERLGDNPSPQSVPHNGLSDSHNISQEDIEIAFLREKQTRAAS